jgi:hypothetical protein
VLQPNNREQGHMTTPHELLKDPSRKQLENACKSCTEHFPFFKLLLDVPIRNFEEAEEQVPIEFEWGSDSDEDDMMAKPFIIFYFEQPQQIQLGATTFYVEKMTIRTDGNEEECIPFRVDGYVFYKNIKLACSCRYDFGMYKVRLLCHFEETSISIYSDNPVQELGDILKFPVGKSDCIIVNHTDNKNELRQTPFYRILERKLDHAMDLKIKFAIARWSNTEQRTYTTVELPNLTMAVNNGKWVMHDIKVCTRKIFGLVDIEGVTCSFEIVKRTITINADPDRNFNTFFEDVSKHKKLVQHFGSDASFFNIHYALKYNCEIYATFTYDVTDDDIKIGQMSNYYYLIKWDPLVLPIVRLYNLYIHDSSRGYHLLMYCGPFVIKTHEKGSRLLKLFENKETGYTIKESLAFFKLKLPEESNSAVEQEVAIISVIDLDLEKNTLTVHGSIRRKKWSVFASYACPVAKLVVDEQDVYYLEYDGLIETITLTYRREFTDMSINCLH